MEHDFALNVGHVRMNDTTADNGAIFSSKKIPEENCQPCFILHSVV